MRPGLMKSEPSVHSIDDLDTQGEGFSQAAPDMGRADRLRAELDALLSSFDFARRRAVDPVHFVRRYSTLADQEIAAALAACLAYGRADLIGRALLDVGRRVGPSPARAAETDSEASARSRFDGFVYRFTRGEDLARLWLGLGEARRTHGSLGAAFAAGDESERQDLRPALSAFRDAVWAATPSFASRRGFEHLLPDPRRGSACKRQCLWLRWMVRGPDAVDLGLWPLSPSRLTIPLDTHVHRIGRLLGLTARRQADWRTAAEITAGLRALDSEDPLRYDFALAHMGISGRCPTRRDAALCADCNVRRVCRLDAPGHIRSG